MAAAPASRMTPPQVLTLASTGQVQTIRMSQAYQFRGNWLVTTQDVKAGLGGFGSRNSRDNLEQTGINV